MILNKIPSRLLATLLIAGVGLFNVACSDESSQQQEGHVWQEQTDTLDKARAVEETLLNSAEQQRKDIEQQTQ